VLYDSEYSQIAYDDDGAGNHNFKIEYYLEEGQAYYLEARFYNNQTGSSYTVTLALQS
jgi:hypothetical protein